MGKATEDLRNEHEAILHVLTIMDAMISDTGKEDKEMFKYYSELVTFLKTFADKCHHGKEENYLFMEMEKHGVPDQGGPIGVMLYEHAEGREYIAAMDKAVQAKDRDAFVKAAVKYADLLRNHIEKENQVLFMMADKVLDDEKQNELFEHFEQHEEDVIGHGVHEELHEKIHQWSEAFGVKKE